MNLSATALKAIEAYGGIELWQNKKYIEAEVNASGLAFILKRRPFFKNAFLKMQIAQPICSITPIGKSKTVSGILNHHDTMLQDANGTIIETRKDARRYFPYGRRLFYWDDLDMAYFANYAFWNYFTLPALLMNNSI